MAVVHHDQRVVPLGEVTDVRQAAMSPSIEKTPSVAMSRSRLPAASFKPCSSSPIAECR